MNMMPHTKNRKLIFKFFIKVVVNTTAVVLILERKKNLVIDKQDMDLEFCT